MAAKITVREVAKHASVSIGTVSRVLNDDPAVSVDAAKRVQEAVKALNYTPLRRTRTDPERPLDGRNIALIMLGMDRSMAGLPVVAEAVHGAEQALAGLGAKLLLADLPDLKHVPGFVSGARLDGAILKGALQGRGIADSKTALIRHLRDTPTVWILGRPEGCWGDAVQADDMLSGEMVADHLADMGHRRLAFLNPKPNHVTFLRRQLGFVSRAQARGATVAVFEGDQNRKWTLPLKSAQDVACIQGLVDQVLAASKRPTAIYTPSDSCAALVYRALAVAGLTVGEDISVISTNNETALTNVLYPGLTTLDVNAAAIGHCAADQLSWRLAHPREPDITLSLRPTLIPRDSVADLR